MTNLLDRFTQLRLMVFDLDGVMTNGKILLMDDDWVREMDIKDGYAIQHAIKNGLKIAVITGSHSNPVASRLKKLGVHFFFQNIKHKGDCLKQIMADLCLQKSQVLFMGDDIPDLEAFSEAGITSCPADAVREIKQQSNFISTKSGGDGCVREIIEKVMLAQNTWNITSNTQSI